MFLISKKALLERRQWKVTIWLRIGCSKLFENPWPKIQLRYNTDMWGVKKVDTGGQIKQNKSLTWISLQVPCRSVKEEQVVCPGGKDEDALTFSSEQHIKNVIRSQEWHSSFPLHCMCHPLALTGASLHQATSRWARVCNSHFCVRDIRTKYQHVKKKNHGASFHQMDRSFLWKAPTFLLEEIF